jgi:hypothetical protein
MIKMMAMREKQDLKALRLKDKGQRGRDREGKT